MDNLFLSPLEISRSISRIGEKKASATTFELFFSGILAGIYIAFGAAAALAVTSGGTLDAGAAKFLAGSVFSVGLILVLIPGSELFTGNILMSIGYLDRRYSLPGVLRNWLIVYFSNLLGALIVAGLVFHSGLLGRPGALSAVGTATARAAEMKLKLDFLPALSRGILCNMLVCLAVIMAIASRTITGKILGIYFPIMAFVASGYEHSVANMYFLPAGLLADGNFLTGFFTIFHNLIPVTLGNIIGGLLIVLLHPKSGERMVRRRAEKEGKTNV